MIEARQKYTDVCERIGKSENEHGTLIGKLDTMEFETKSLKSKIESIEIEEKTVYDSYFLGKVTEEELKSMRGRVQDSRNELALHSKMIESLNRCIKTKEREISALHRERDVFRHEVWYAFFEQRAAEIPEKIRDLVKELICIGLQASMHRDYILPKIFQLPTNSEIQKLYKNISTNLGIE